MVISTVLQEETHEEDVALEVVVDEGKTAELKCPIETTSTPRWTKRGEDVDHDRADYQDKTLVIKESMKEDAGVYICSEPDNSEVVGKVALRIAGKTHNKSYQLDKCLI